MTRRMGRPRGPLPEARADVTRYVRQFVNRDHGGNVMAASQAARIAYATLRDLYTGRNVNPTLGTVQAVVAAYGIHHVVAPPPRAA